MKFRVTNTGSRAETAIVVVGGGLQCTTGCRAEPNLAPGKSKDFEARLVAPAAAPGEISGLNISVAVRLGGQNSYDFKMVYVHGSGASSPTTSKPPSGVSRVSGRVRDTGGKALGGAAVTIRDSAGHEYRVTSDRSGRFAMKSNATKPIAAGRITVVATLDGYRTNRETVQGRAGDTATVAVSLAAVPVPVPTTRTPSPDAATDEPATTHTSAADAAPLDLKTVSDEGGSSPLFFTLGGLLVAAGVGALALVLIRRRNKPAATGAGSGDAPTEVLRLGPH
ncbi:carboxypeptidase-like regulatory domain-containing protein [Actinoplanes sp. NPDC049596]|uniref:carboxypeptidase-like regulatory domain-containing protein n=1 Tax=unclassified Actinoplanes TaxID=2626549 RepID=UPI00342CC714